MKLRGGRSAQNSADLVDRGLLLIEGLERLLAVGGDIAVQGLGLGLGGVELCLGGRSDDIRLLLRGVEKLLRLLAGLSDGVVRDADGGRVRQSCGDSL